MDNQTVLNSIDNDTATLEENTSRGPLLTVAIALFGNGSFIQQRAANPDKFITPLEAQTYNRSLCIELIPLRSLLVGDPGSSVEPVDVSGLAKCVYQNDVADMGQLQAQMAGWVEYFYYNHWDGDQQIEKAFGAAVYLANEAWLLSATLPSLSVSYDLGTDTLVPAISLPGIVIISILLGIYLFMLVALAVYSYLQPSWTSQLDSFAMMRLGATLAGHEPLLVGKASEVEILDDTPGWIGDTQESLEQAGQLGLGAMGPIHRDRRFAPSKVHSR